MNGLLLQTDADPSSIARYKLGEVLSETVEGHDFLQAQFYLDEATSLRLTLAVPRGAVAGFYARRDSPPSFTSYELFHVVDANKVVLTTSSLRHRRRSSDDLQHTSVRLIISLSFINTPRSVSESHLLTHSHLCHTVICCRNSTKTDSNCYWTFLFLHPWTTPGGGLSTTAGHFSHADLPEFCHYHWVKPWLHVK